MISKMILLFRKRFMSYLILCGMGLILSITSHCGRLNLCALFFLPQQYPVGKTPLLFLRENFSNRQLVGKNLSVHLNHELLYRLDLHDLNV